MRGERGVERGRKRGEVFNRRAFETVGQTGLKRESWPHLLITGPSCCRRRRLHRSCPDGSRVRGTGTVARGRIHPFEKGFNVRQEVMIGHP